MRAFCITLDGHEYSEAAAARCMASAVEVGGLVVERFVATPAAEAEAMMRHYGLRWTWTTDGIRYCPTTGLRQHPYGGGAARIGCALSHYRLWQQCAATDEPLLVLEHDAVFLRAMPDIDCAGICQINDPQGATRRGDWWSAAMTKRGTRGVHPKTWVTRAEEMIPDGLAGNSAYVIRPRAARELIELVHDLGVWPNDATMCAQLLPYLEEYYPFITRVEQSMSTTSV